MTDLTVEDVDRLLAIASRHGVLELEFGGLRVRRLPAVEKQGTPAEKAEWERIEKLPPDQQDAELMIRRAPGVR